MEQIIEIYKDDPKSVVLDDTIRVAVDIKAIKDYARLVQRTFPGTKMKITNRLRNVQ